MAESENHHGASPAVAVVLPLFPALPGQAESLASLAAQTRPPNLVVLLDDGSSQQAEELAQSVPDLHTEIVQVQPCPLPGAINALTDYLAHFDFVGLLLAGDAYEPDRIRRCLEALEPGDKPRPPVMVITEMLPVDGRLQPLPAEDPRVLHHERLWAPGRRGASLAEWLGSGHFAATASNLFLRRDHLADFPLLESTQAFAHAAVATAGLQGLLTILHEPLLRHYPAPVESEPTMRTMIDRLQAEQDLLLALADRLAVSPETRRNLATYHRNAWNSLSSVREDLFQQLLLRLASSVPPEEAQAALAEILRSHEAQTAPAHWTSLHEGADPLDLAGYADTLRRTRDKLLAAREDNERLKNIAAVAQDSGWVRLGAWLGERNSRRIMELEEEDSDGIEPPEDEVESGGKSHP